jgi:hypothetical protein
MSIRPALVSAATALAMVVAGLLAAEATADTLAPLYAKMRQHFTARRPGVPTAWSFDGALKPFPADQQVPPQRATVFRFPRGTRLDVASVPACAATDDLLIARGASVCPARSQIGTGQAGIFVGPGAPLAARITVLAARHGLRFLLATDSGQPFRVQHATIAGRTIMLNFPPTQVGNGFQAATIRLKLRLGPAGTSRRPLIRTPVRCPSSRHWTFTYLPRYDPPIGVQRSTSTTPCSPLT